MENHPNKPFYDRISRFYDGIAHSSERKATEEGWRLLSVKPGERILEIGFGTGHSLVEFARLVGATGHVTGVDVSSGMGEVASEKMAEAGVEDRVTIDLAAVPPLACPDASFDAVFLSFTLELFPLNEIPEVLAEVRRVLKPGGRCGVVCMDQPAGPENENLMEQTYEWMHRHFPHIVDCQPIPAVELLEQSGFRVGEVTRMDIWGLAVAAVVADSP
ncbi:MAG: methyltransferase domain-containing protein [Verrucomicrobiae bacterium]|nr:methyltransferase domain-containing protein [Verrucomicrobiae bacterium]